MRAYACSKKGGFVMATGFSVPIQHIIDELSLEPIYMPGNPEELMITSYSVSRPGLPLTGYFDFFDKTRIIVFGHTEFSFLSRFGAEQQYHVISSLFKFGPVAGCGACYLLKRRAGSENHAPRRSGRGIRRRLSHHRRQRSG